MCRFDLSLLPIKLNLPMVYEPLSWTPSVRTPSTLSDLRGGYLSGPTVEIYHRFQLLSTRDLSHFYVQLHDPEYRKMCDIMNHLQSQAFEINTPFLEFVMEHRHSLEEAGLLMPRELAHVNMKEASDLLKEFYLSNTMT